jgi:SAM-dependent methyltransferase
VSRELTREQSHWERLAADDPMWVILTEPGKKGRWTEEQFFESGRDEIERTLANLQQRFSLTPKRGVAVDFGCGIGRLTQALATRFQRVHGIDISERMVRLAEEKNRQAQVTFHVNTSDRLPMLESHSVDFIYSRLTLQHIPRSAARRYVEEFARALAPGGIAFFQTMTRARRWDVRLRHRVRDAAPEAYRWARDLVSHRARWEMNVFDEASVRASLRGTGVDLRHVLPDDSGGTAFESRCFIAVRGNDA